MAAADRNPRRPMPHIKNQLRPLSDSLGYINDFVTCPYNEHHVMKYHKLMRHLVKCEREMKKSEPGGGDKGEGETTLPEGFERCPYDSLHRFRSGMKEEHYRECKARAHDLLVRMRSGEDIGDADARYDFPKNPAPKEL